MAEYEFGFRRKGDVNPEAIKGEQGTGYQDGKLGPVRCDNCRHMKDGCDQEDMRRNSSRPRKPNGNVVVDMDSFCIYIDRPGGKK